MKKFHILIGLAIVLMAVPSCHKGTVPQGSSPVWGDGTPLTFHVAAQDIGSRSHFMENSSTLDWDEDDVIGVIAVPYDENLGKYRFDLIADTDHVGLATYRGKDEQNHAIFRSTEENSTWWQAEGYTDDDCLYGFFAYYPAFADAEHGVTPKHPFKLYGQDVNIGFVDNYAIDYIYSPEFYVNPVQDGVHFNQHHILYDLSHLPMLDIENPTNKAKLFSVADLLAEADVSFTDFEPVTSMLMFRLIGDGEEHVISSVKMTVKTYESYTKGGGDTIGIYDDVNGAWYYLDFNFSTYYLPFFGIAGQGISPTAFHSGFQQKIMDVMEEEDTKDKDSEPSWAEDNYEHLMATALVSAETSLMPHFNGLTQNMYSLHSSNSVTVNFETPVTVPAYTGTAIPTDYFYMVLYPTFIQAFDNDIKGVAHFDAIDTNGDVVLSCEKSLPANGFRAGIRHKATLSLVNGVSYSGGSAGEYEIVEVETN